MSESKPHTPKWEARPYGGSWAVFDDRGRICYMYGAFEDRGEIETRDNAMRIAAVNELLAALQGLMYLTDQGREGGMILSRYDHKPITNGDQDIIDRAYIAADAAIRKARGESQ